MAKKISGSFPIILTIAITSFLWASNKSNNKQLYPYQNSKLSIEERVNDLLSRMSLEEKVRQMDMYNAEHFIDEDLFSLEKANELLGELGAGAMHVRGFQSNTVKLCNEAQEYAIQHSRWGIPVLFLEEALHGAYTKESTLFPIPLALASTWDKELIESVGKVIATESRAHGIALGLGPVLGIARDPRWGRVEETYGEDPHLVSEIGLAMISGLQGKELKSDRSIIAEPKHFAVHSQPLAGSNCMAVFTSEREARSSFLIPFEKAFHIGKARATMSAYSEWNGFPCTGNKWLLTDLLRNEWGFNGMVISDLGAVSQLETEHHIADSPKDAIKQAVQAGVNMEFYDFSNNEYQNNLIQLVNEKQLSMSIIDSAVASVLRIKFELGLFEDPYTDPNLSLKRNHTEANKEVALKAAEEAICLLKNDNDILPLKKSIKTIAVLGPNADNNTLAGGYSREDVKVMTVVEGIKKIAGEKITVLHEKAIPIVMKGIAIPSEYLWLPDLSANGLKGEYFNNQQLTGDPVLERNDEQVDFKWGSQGPSPDLYKDGFSARWTGYLIPKEDISGWIGLSCDEGGRLFIDDKKVVEKKPDGTIISNCQMEFKAGQNYKIKLEYYEDTWDANVSLRWDYKAYQIDKAVELAKKSDVAVVVLGENSSIVGENKDRTSLGLYGGQLEFLREIYKTGTPVVVVLLNGRPISIPWVDKNVPAIIEAWFPGEMGGLAIAKVLFGLYNPAGRLPITVPYSVGQCPIYYNQKAWHHHKNVDGPDTPLYPFGYGLSYSTFEYSNLKLTSLKLGLDDSLKVTLDIKNTGKYDGEEVVQLYINDLVSSVTTPYIELKDFERVKIKSGQTVTVTFDISVSQLALWNKQMQKVVEPGEFQIMIGSSSRDIHLSEKIVIVD